MCSLNFFSKSKELVFYTCFFGNNYNWANLIPQIPSERYDCFYFTNNHDSLNKLKNTKWKVVFIDIPIKNDNTESAFDSKHLKTCPHLYEILNNYDYVCYFDSKHNVDCIKVEKLVCFLKNSNYIIVLPEHPAKFQYIWDEYALAMTVDKYRVEQEKCLNYIKKQLKHHFSEKVDRHLTTQFILRKNDAKTSELNELWFSHIQECGIMCQISFFFIQQIFQEYILPIEYKFCYSYCF